MNALDYNPARAGKRWVACFDRLGFGNYCKNNALVDVFCETSYWLERAMEEAEDYKPMAELAWFSDTILFTSFPQVLRKMCWVGASALPQGREEK